MFTQVRHGASIVSTLTRSIVRSRPILLQYRRAHVAVAQHRDDDDSVGGVFVPLTHTYVPTTLPSLSHEQEIARSVLEQDDGNVIINACAGSGKTTTVLQMANNIKKKFLVLLYNRRLRAETIQRAESLGLDNLNIDNYHGLGYRHYSTECSTDQGLKRVVLDDMKLHTPLPDFDILVMDEQQDMNPIIFQFVRKLLKDSTAQRSSPPQLMLLGDPRQEIYQFNNADRRFLTMYKDLFPLSGDIGPGSVSRKWTELEHRTSYRMTQQIADFVNKQLLRLPKSRQILTIRQKEENPKPRYLLCDAFSDAPMKEFLRLLDLGLTPSQILILGPSMRSKINPVRTFANKLALDYPHISLYIPSDDDEDISTVVRLNKLVFASYHQAKGIEREAAILFNFDASYHTFYDRHEENFQTVGNVQYVAATRAKKHLVMIHHHKYNYLPFLTPKSLGRTCELIKDKEIQLTLTKPAPRWRWAVTQLTRNIPEEVVSYCFGMLNLNLVRPPNVFRIYPPTQIEVKEDVWEGVSAITGTAIPAIFQWETTGICTLCDEIFKRAKQKRLPEELMILEERFPQYRNKILEIEKQMDEHKVLTNEDILYIANISNMLQSGYISSVTSIPFDKYNWVTEADTETIYKIMKRHISPSAKYEHPIMTAFEDAPVDEHDSLVAGRTDVQTKSKVWELKFTNTLRPENVLQLALYGAIRDRAKTRWKKKELKEQAAEEGLDEAGLKALEDAANEKPFTPTKCFLLHLPTNQVVEVASKKLEDNKDGYIELLKRLISAKVDKPTLAVTDDEFLEEAQNGFKTLIGSMTVPPWLNTTSWITQTKKGKGIV